jgi:UDP-N-acetyl-D-mannosaminuronic acid dehydrogenase
MKKDELKVVLMGLGYIGLPTAALMAGKGLHVHGVDVNRETVETINQGRIHIVEPDLEGLVHYCVKQGLLVADTQPVYADVFLVAVPTPFKENNKPDLSYVESATRMVLPFLKPGCLYIIESTSPVGTTEKMAELIFSQRPELRDQIHIAYCPERVLPGNVIHELQHNDRVIGGINEKSTHAAIEFYSRFVKGSLHPTHARTAEMCKLAENAYRDVNIAFANELSIISDKAGIDVNELIELASKHPRVKILKPGPGVGGHCIAVDPWFIISDFENEAQLIRQARMTNNAKKDWVLSKIEDAAGELESHLNRKPVIACMGLTYKADIDDVRESPAMEIYSALKKKSHTVKGVEPHLPTGSEHIVIGAEEAVHAADLIVFLVAHHAFKNIALPAGKKILDFCGALR